MSPKRPITTSFPLGLFCTATLSTSQTDPSPETTTVSPPLNRKLLDMPALIPETDGLDENIYWDDGSV